MKEDKQIRELNNIIKAFDKKSSYPSIEFEMRLKDKLLSSNQNEFKGFWNKLFFGIGNLNTSRYLNYSGVLLLIMLLTGIFYYFLNNRYTLHEQVRTIEGNEQYSLLTQVYANNPQALLSFDKPLSTSTISDTINNSAISELIATPEAQLLKNYNYFHIATSVSFGPFSENCIGLNTDNSKIEIFSFEGDTKSNVSDNYFKFIEYNSDNSLLDYQLVRNDLYYRYFGAATTTLYSLINTDNIEIYKDNDMDADTDNTLMDDSDVENMFGSDLTLEEIITGDKLLYKIIKRTPNNFCYFNDQDAQDKSSSAPGEIITVLLIDPFQDFAVIEAQYYFDVELMPNQIMVIRNNQERLLLDNEEADILFQYDLPYPVEMELTPKYMDVEGIRTNIGKRIKD